MHAYPVRYAVFTDAGDDGATRTVLCAKDLADALGVHLARTMKSMKRLCSDLDAHTMTIAWPAATRDSVRDRLRGEQFVHERRRTAAATGLDLHTASLFVALAKKLE